MNKKYFIIFFEEIAVELPRSAWLLAPSHRQKDADENRPA
jgi:hypothetical protein